MCAVLLPPGVNPIAVNKYIISYHISYHIISKLAKILYIQGGSNMTGTNLYVNKCKQSRSYLNHLVYVCVCIYIYKYNSSNSHYSLCIDAMCLTGDLHVRAVILCNNCRLHLKCDGTRAETIFRLSAKRTGPFKSAGESVLSTTGSRGVRISGSNAGYTMFRGSVKSNGYPLHSPVSPSLPLPCVTVWHHISAGVYFNVNVICTCI